MTISQKLKEIRKRFGLSQEQLAEIMNVSRQAITKWESGNGLPDVANLKELSRVFNVSIDYLLDNESELPFLVMKKAISKEQYKNPTELLKKLYPEPCEIFSLFRERKRNTVEHILDFISLAFTSIEPIYDSDMLTNSTKNYLIKKGNIKFLAIVSKENMEIRELINVNIDKKHFVVDNYRYYISKKEKQVIKILI